MMLIQKNIPLKNHSNIKIGGPASYFSEFRLEEDLKEILSSWSTKDPKMDNIFILGEGTNILFNDDGFSGLVLKNKIDFIEREGNYIKVGAGTSMSKLIKFYTQNNYSGFEWAGGLPGTVGGAIRGNAGAFGGETKDVVVEVISMNMKTQKIIKRINKECKFSYRNSTFKTGPGKKEIVLSVKFKYNLGNSEEIKKLTQEKIDYRIERHPLEHPNIGSIFKNIPIDKVSIEVREKFNKSIKIDPFPVMPTAKILVDAGLIGKGLGGAMISEKHPNYIINIDNAKADDIKNLISVVKKKIKNEYKIELEEEISIVS